MNADNEPTSSLLEALLPTPDRQTSDSTEEDGAVSHSVQFAATTPVSPLYPNVENSPNRSFLETSFYDHWRNFIRGSGYEDDAEEGDISEPTQRDDECPSIVRIWSKLMFRHHSLLLFLTITILWPAGYISYSSFHKHTDSTFHPMPGSPSKAAMEAFAAAYGDDDWQNPMNPPLLLLLKSSNNESLVSSSSNSYETARNFALNMTQVLSDQWIDPDCHRGQASNSTMRNKTDSCWALQVTSYYSLQDEALDMVAQSMVSRDGFATVIEVQYIPPKNWRGDEKARIFALLDIIEAYSSREAPEEFFSVHFTGVHWFQRDLIAGTHADIHRMDAVALPLALLLMGAVLPGANGCVVWVIPLITMISTVATWSIIMNIVVRHIQITQFTPTVMMSLTIGMGIDYTLFLLSRYVERPFLSGNEERQKSIAHVLWYGGNVIVWSGITLLCCFLGLVALPLSMLQSVGVGAAVSIASALFINLTVVPLLLSTELGRVILKKKSGDNVVPSSAGDDDGTARPRSNTLGSMRHDVGPVEESSSVWYLLARQLLHPYKGAIFVLILLQGLLPLGFHSLKLTSSLSFDLLLPSDSPSLRTYHELGSLVGQGRLHPYRILFDGNEANVTITSPKGFQAMHRLIDKLMRIDQPAGYTGGNDFDIPMNFDALRTNGTSEIKFAETVIGETVAVAKDSPSLGEKITFPGENHRTIFNGISVLENQHVPNLMYATAKLCGAMEPYCPIEVLHVIDQIDRASTSHDMHSTYVTVTLGTNPFSEEGISWLKSARRIAFELAENDELFDVNVYIEGLPSIEFDAMYSVYREFPRMITTTALTVFVLVGVFSRSLLAPLRSIISMSLTLGFSFGLGVLIYQDGALSVFELRPFEPIDGGFCWLVPVMAFSIIVGLALDYDVFLISSMIEFRQRGYDHSASIAVGLHSTGRIITAAGGIMAVAFGCLLFSSSPILYQFSLLLTSAVLLDTFVVRTIVVPVVTSLAGKWCWWPRSFPESRYCLQQFRHERQYSDDLRSLVRSLEDDSEYETINQLQGSA